MASGGLFGGLFDLGDAKKDTPEETPQETPRPRGPRNLLKSPVETEGPKGEEKKAHKHKLLALVRVRLTLGQPAG